MKTSKLRIHVLVPLSIVLTTLLAAFVVISYQTQQKRINEDVLSRQSSVKILFENKIAADLRLLRMSLDLISQDVWILSAWQWKNRTRLYEFAKPIFENLRNGSKIDGFSFTDAKRVNFLRVHQKEIYGDVNNRFSQLQAEKLRQEFHGIELGDYGELSLRVVRPVYKNKKLVGYIELAKSIENVALEIRNITNVDLLVLIDKMVLNREKWELGLRAFQEKGSWDILKNSVITKSTPQILHQGLIDILNLETNELRAVADDPLKLGDQIYRLSFLPLKQVGSRKVGEMVTLDNVTVANASLQKSLRSLIFVSAVAWLVLFTLYYILLGRVQKRLIDYQQKLLEESKSRNEAEQSNQAKTDFLCNMSHEIRTPLNAILGNTELALDTNLTYEQRNYLSVVQRSSETLLELIGDILDLSKIEKGELESTEIAFDLRKVIDQVNDQLAILTFDKEVEFVCNVDPSLPNSIIGDSDQLKRILVKLLRNAFKFTEKGEIVLKVLPYESDLEENYLEENHVSILFMIADTGVGISKEYQEMIFDKFSQADTSSTRKFGGAGLGLSITKSLTESKGGRLWVDSQEGRGTTFHFLLNYAVAETDSETGITFQNSEKVSILVVDDNQSSRSMLENMLSAWKFNVSSVCNGSEALAFLKQKDKKVNVLLLDQEMPEKDGLEVARAIRDELELNDLKIVLMITGKENPSPASARKVKIDRYITKPVKQATLQEVLEGILKGKSAGGDSFSKAPVIVDENKLEKRILLVEDNQDNQNLAKMFLVKAGYEVDISDNGKLAVEAIQNSSYDLVLMDIQMPVMDGFEATKEIRNFEQDSEGGDRIPIIALTAHALKEYRQKCLDNDMDDYITKPIKRKVLLETVTKWTAEG